MTDISLGGKTYRFDWDLRLMKLLAPDTTCTGQELINVIATAHAQEAQANDRQIASWSGKQDLGGGILVAPTIELLNDWLFGFEARKTQSAAGTVTTGDANGVKLIDSGAAFLTTASVGASIINFTDQSVATVTRVVDDSELWCDGLSSGSDDQFEVGDAYKLFPEVVCSVTSGNLLARELWTGDIRDTPLAGSFGVSGWYALSSTGTLLQSNAIEYSSYNQGRGPSVDLTSSYSGTNYPVGTSRQPVNNFDDALAICAARGFRELFVSGASVAINSGNFDGKRLNGDSPSVTSIVIGGTASVAGTEYADLSIHGALGTNSHLDHCAIDGDVTGIDGHIDYCQLGPYDITLSGSGAATFIGCSCGSITAVAMPTIKCNGSGSVLVMQRYVGYVRVADKTGSELVGISLDGGIVYLDATIDAAAAPFIIQGVGSHVDGSTDVALDVSDLVSPGSVTSAVEAGDLGAAADLLGVTGKVVDHKDAIDGVPGHIRVPADGSEQDIPVKKIADDQYRLNEP